MALTKDEKAKRLLQDLVDLSKVTKQFVPLDSYDTGWVQEAWDRKLAEADELLKVEA